MMKLVFALVLCLAVATSVAQLDFSISPQDAVEGSTDSVTLNCQYTGPTDVLDRNFVLLLFHTDVNGTTSQVASVDEQQVVVSGTNRTQAEGSITEEPYHLTVTISEPLEEDSGDYECRMVSLATNYNTLTPSQTASLNVTVQPDYVPEEPKVIVPAPSCDCDKIWEEIDGIKAALASRPTSSGTPAVASSECQVSFAAQFSQLNGNPIVGGETVVFNDAPSNKGDAYSTSTGEFTAPCDGQYFFSVALRSHQDLDAGYVDGVLMADDVRVARTSTFVNSNDLNIALATTGSVVTLTQGQKVKVLIQSTSSGSFKGREFSIFSGFYMFP